MSDDAPQTWGNDPTRPVRCVGEAMIEMAPRNGDVVQLGFAGDTFNTAWHLCELLRDKAGVGFVSSIGRDTLSDRFIKRVSSHGLDPACLHRHDDRTMGLYLIELVETERRFQYWRQDSAARCLADDTAVLARALGHSGLIHLSGITLAILAPAARRELFDVMSRGRAGGAMISFDPNIRTALWPSRSEMLSVLSDAMDYADVVLASAEDMATLYPADDADAAMTRLRAREVVLTDGARDVMFREGGRYGRIPTPPADTVKDTSGAGDAFNAGFLAARYQGASFEAAIESGSRCAAKVIAVKGALGPVN